MSNRLIQKGIRRVALVDDVEDDTISDGILLRSQGFETTYINGQFRSVDELVERVSDQADFVICDNCLQQSGNYANFLGAEAVARWYDRAFPAILVTQYEHDIDTSIRSYGRKIPRTLKKVEVDLEPIMDALDLCLDEFRGIFTPEREPCRTMVEIARVDRERREVYGRIMSWDYKRAVPFQLDLIPAAMRDRVTEGAVFTAMVNTGAADINDLYLVDFEIAPDPFPEDQIG